MNDKGSMEKIRRGQGQWSANGNAMVDDSVRAWENVHTMLVRGRGNMAKPYSRWRRIS